MTQGILRFLVAKQIFNPNNPTFLFERASVFLNSFFCAGSLSCDPLQRDCVMNEELLIAPNEFSDRHAHMSPHKDNTFQDS